MLTPLAIVSMLSLPADAAAPCFEGGIRHAAATLSPIGLASVPSEEDDPRYGLHEGGPLLGIKPEEQPQLVDMIGKVECPSKQPEIGSLGNGFLIGGDADAILTNAHLPIDKDGKQRLTDLSTCYFASSARPDDHIPLKFEDDQSKYGTKSPVKYRSRDYVIVKLARPVAGVKPIRIASDVDQISGGESLMMLSQVMFKMPKDRKVLPGEPIIQQAEVLGQSNPDYEGGTLIKTLFANTPGASGSLVFRRNKVDQQLEIVGVHEDGGDSSDDGKVISKENKNWSVEVAVRGGLKLDLERALKRRQAQSN